MTFILYSAIFKHFNMSDKEFNIVGLGEILWDMFPHGKKLGGAPANFAYHAQCFGGKGFVVSSVGGDDLGNQILEQMESMGLSKKYVAIDRRHPTGTVTVKLDEAGQPKYTIHEEVAWDNIPYSEHLAELAARTDAVCFGSLAQRSDVSHTTINKFLKATSPGSLRVFDVNLREAFFSKEIICDSLKLCNILKLNNDELPVIAELCLIKGDEKEILSALIEKYSLDLVALTMGKEGSRLITAGEDSFYEAEDVEVVDAVGAGDSFTGALVMGLLNKSSLISIHKHAARVADYVCTQKGATPEIPDDLVDGSSGLTG